MSSTNGPPNELELAEVERLVRGGSIAQAADRLEAALSISKATHSQWLQLAGLRRALRQPIRSLAAVNSALALAPLDFMGLVLRASLLEQIGDPSAGAAWDAALAQKPVTPVPEPLASAVSLGEAFHANWVKEREDRLMAAMRELPVPGDDLEARRIARFRSNILRKTQTYHSQPTHFDYPSLARWEFYPRSKFPALAVLEAAASEIRAELETVMQETRAELIPYIEYADHMPLAQWRELNRNKDWTAIHLLRGGEPVEANTQFCPQTLAAIAKMPQPQIEGASPNAMFSLLAPNTTIPPHVGVNNARLVCHLPLIVPQGCWFRVGAETRSWEEGKAFVFDDTIEHEAANPSDQLRAVLIIDLWHPDLSVEERAAISAMVAADQADEMGL